MVLLRYPLMTKIRLGEAPGVFFPLSCWVRRPKPNQTHLTLILLDFCHNYLLLTTSLFTILTTHIHTMWRNNSILNRKLSSCALLKPPMKPDNRGVTENPSKLSENIFKIKNIGRRLQNMKIWKKKLSIYSLEKMGLNAETARVIVYLETEHVSVVNIQ